MAYDAATKQVVLFGNAAAVSQTWTWDGSNWTLTAPETSPPPRIGEAISYDSARQQILLFGGSMLGDTWVWDGPTWTEKVDA
jgi:hypothetical protein